MRRFATLPFAAALIVLLIACANVAGLLLARATSRRHEIDTRLALGARRLRIVRQLLIESGVLALAGGLTGLALGIGLTRWLRSLLPERYLFLAFDVDFGIDWQVFAFMLGVAVTTGVVFGLVPSIQASRSDLAATLRASRGSRVAPGARVRRVLVVAQVALSLTLLVAAGLCVRTLQHASAIDTGYDPTRVLTARLDLAKQRYQEARGRAFQSELIERLRARPGIEAAGFAVTLPLNDGRWEDAVRRAGDPTRFQTFQNVISAGYFDAMKIPLVAGRGFADSDGEDAPRVAIVNQRLAQMLWPGESPIGKIVDFDRRPHRVIGLARDIKGRDLFGAPGPMLYQSIAQAYSPAVVLHVRGTLPTAALTSLVRDEIGALDRGLPIHGVKMLDEHVTATLTPQRLLAYLITGFGLLALLLTAVGLYGLLSYTVTQRTPEIGIRMALGATSGRVVGIFLGEGLKMVLMGVGAGIGGAVFLTRLMRGVLFGVSPGDPLTFVSGALLLSLAGLLACYIPARRAARADPNVALRCD